MTTKFIPEQPGLTGVFAVTDAIFLSVGHAFEASEDILAALDALGYSYTDPPGNIPTGRLRIFRPDNSQVLLLIGESQTPDHVPSNCFFLPNESEREVIAATLGYETELGPLDPNACGIGEEVFPSNYFNSDTGLIDSAGMDPFDGNWSTEGDGWTTWTPTKLLVEGEYAISGVLETTGNDAYISVGGNNAFVPDRLHAEFSGTCIVREPTQQIRINEGNGLPLKLDSLFIHRVR
jgi:hypothetical protein